MSFTFKRKESVPESVYRLLESCSKRALKNSESGNLEAIHATRKEIKKIRAVLRLVRHEIGKGAFQERLDGLREAADILAPARDSQVRAQTLDNVVRPGKKGFARGSFERFRATLKEECEEEAIRFQESKCAKEVRRILRKERKHFGKLHFKNDGWAAIGPGVKKSYSAAREARDLTRKDGAVDNFHEWRKRVKDLWYNTQLLEPIWPEQMCAVAAELEKLGELLGNDHDLYVLRQNAIKKSVNVDLEGETLQLLKSIDTRQSELRSAALKLGNRFFKEKPTQFCDRLHLYWKHWKSKSGKERVRPKDLAAKGA